MSKESALLAELANALAKDEFVFYYQPKISMISGQICGVEALLRWPQPDGSLRMPDTFIPLAEKTDFITEITLGMLPHLLEDKSLIHAINPSITIALNASAKDFETPRLTEKILDHVNEHAGTHNIEVEITEASLLSGNEEIKNNLYALPEAGVPLTMDDFAEGFSNIDRLASYPFSSIKLDRGIVQRVWESKKDVAIIHSSIRLAHKLGLETVAEGIEDWRIYHCLLNAGCTQGQGFWISKPLPLLELLDLLHNAPHWPALPVGLLYMAELDHIEWRKELLDMVFFLQHYGDGDVGPNEESMPHHVPELNHLACGLGKWYYGPGRLFIGNQYYDALEKPHQRLHEIARQLLKAAKDGKNNGEVNDSMHKLSEESAIIIQLLQMLQNTAVEELGNLDSEKIRSSFARDIPTITFPVLSEKFRTT